MIGKTLHNRYHIESQLGRGGMGIVYKARDILLNRVVAIKFLNTLGVGTEGRARLLQEARATAQLNHPNIVSVFDVGEVDSNPFIVMEFIQGNTLKEIPTSSLPDALARSTQICRALEHAHSKGIIHRDLKLENIIITESQTLKLMDFGLARTADDVRLTEEGAISGTLAYLAPELIEGEPANAQSDLYAFGIILYELLVGHAPFEGTVSAILAQHIHGKVTPPNEVNPQIPAWLDDLVLRLLRKRPKERPVSAKDVLQILEQKSSSSSTTDYDSTSPSPHNNFPSQLAPFSGREKEIKEVEEAPGKNHLVTPTESGSAGKTPLALQIAANLNKNMNWLIGSSKQNDAKKLIAILSDSAKRDAAARKLIALGVDSVPPLIDALQTQDLGLLLHYQQILARISSATLPLTKALAAAHPTIRARVAKTLGLSKDKSAIPALLTALKDEYYIVRESTVFALGNIGDAQVVPLLLPFLKDKDPEVRSAACVAIAKFCDPSTFDEITNVLLDDPKIEVRQSAAIALGETKHPAAIPFLMEALRDSYWWFEREQAAADLLNAIEKMGPAIVEPLIEALGDKEGTVRKFAATILGNLGDPRAMEELGMALYDMHHEVGEMAADALVKFGSKAVDILIESMSHPEAGVREHAIVALGKIQDARVFPVLIEMLQDPDRENQKQAMLSLGKLRDQRVLPVLQEIASNRADRELSVLAKQIIESMK